jgi:hypothetical protein
MEAEIHHSRSGDGNQFELQRNETARLIYDEQRSDVSSF